MKKGIHPEYVKCQVTCTCGHQFEILSTKESLRVDGEVLNILEYKDSYRYCIKIFPKSEKEIKIKKYVKFCEVPMITSKSHSTIRTIKITSNN